MSAPRVYVQEGLVWREVCGRMRIAAVRTGALQTIPVLMAGEDNQPLLKLIRSVYEGEMPQCYY